MSRILRRPMFRGGRVSSYGTGIASGLADGGRVNYEGGGQIGGGIIYGQPMADGRYGFQDVKLFDVKDSIGEIETGQKITDENVPASNWENLVELEKFEDVTKYDEDFLQKQFDSFVGGVERRVKLGSDDAFMTDVDLGMQLQPPIDPEDAAFLKIFKEDPEQAYEFWKNNISTWGTKQKKQMEHAERIGADVDYGIKTKTPETPELTEDQKKILELERIIAAREEKPEVDAKTMVAENKELFRDLLGYKEARGDDISEMLLGFAGAEGDDTWSKTKAFFKDESKRPGRAQKISDAAGTLAIQDYIAGKRSKEQMLSDKSKIDYAQDVKIKALIPQESDSLTDVAIKLSGLDTNLNSLKGLKIVIGTKDKTPTGNLVYTSNVKLDDLKAGKEKVLKNLKKGYNIIDKDNVKWIVKYDGSGSMGGISEPLTINAFWQQTS